VKTIHGALNKLRAAIPDSNEEITEDHMRTSLSKLADDAGLTNEDVSAVLEALPTVRAKRMAVLQRETLRAQAVRESAVPIQQQIALKAAKNKEEKDLIEREANALFDSTRAEDEAKVKAQIEKAQQKKIADADREEHRKAELKEWKKESKAREEQRKEEGVAQAKRKEASRASKIKAIIERVNIVLSDADALYADLKPFRDPRRASDAEKEQIGKALDAASQRCTNAKRLLY
jgi:hypothetical protein